MNVLVSIYVMYVSATGKSMLAVVVVKGKRSEVKWAKSK